MRALLPLLAILTVASIPWGPRRLPADTPIAIIQSGDCAAAQRYAHVIAQTLGYLRAGVTCNNSVGGQAPLRGKTEARMPAVPGLLGYSIPDSQAFWPRGNFLTLEVPSDIPWVSTKATVVAYVKIDALLLDLGVRTGDILETVFALENAGVSRADMTKEPFSEDSLFVRVRPMTVERVLEIERVARQLANPPYHIRVMAFLRDCDGAAAASSGLALAEARARATVMAASAHTSLGEPLAVVDRGGSVMDATCGMGSDATVHQLAIAAEAAGNHLSRGGNLDATIVHTIGAAWRLNLPPNPAGAPWHEIPRTTWDSFGEWVGFLADGKRATADAGFFKNLVADRVRLEVPVWAESALRKSAYARWLTHISYELDPYQPVLVIRASGTAQLTRQIDNVRAFISRLPQRSGRNFDLQPVYGRDDCRYAVHDALFKATSKAVAGLHGQRIRYLQQLADLTAGPVSCTYDPTNDDWSGKDAGPFGSTFASVAVGY